MNPKIWAGEDKSPRATIPIGIDICVAESRGALTDYLMKQSIRR